MSFRDPQTGQPRIGLGLENSGVSLTDSDKSQIFFGFRGPDKGVRGSLDKILETKKLQTCVISSNHSLVSLSSKGSPFGQNV